MWYQTRKKEGEKEIFVLDERKNYIFIFVTPTQTRKHANRSIRQIGLNMTSFDKKARKISFEVKLLYKLLCSMFCIS